ncbi:MAG: UvrD-helicase domain-containing protein [Candidatus Komeilibacteria bacterium]|nr:UvrD-helicase domain-containing protein [Candidatus Komeilibacteria bacterium]
MKFNVLQENIINSLDGAYLISAPVGTGKTTVLAERVVTAIAAGITPEEILGLTFTNRAAEEMTERIRKRVNDKGVMDGLTVKTFHGFCAFFIKVEAKEIGLEADFVIFDETDQEETMRRIMTDFPEINMFYQDGGRVRDLIERLYQYRLRRVENEVGCNLPELKLDPVLLEINRRYEAALLDQNAIDYNGLVLITLHHLYMNEALRRKWGQRYRFIQLDEFQDTHLSEYLVVKELAKKHKNIALIGDLDQTIYGWRGSQPALISKLYKAHFAPVTELKLEVNYRFNSNLLLAVKSFLSCLKAPATTTVTAHVTAETEEKRVKVFAGHNLDEEINWTIENIIDLQKAEPKARIAVLTRANYLIVRVAEVFAAKKIAHTTVDKYDFFRRQEIKDIFAYLKILYNKYDLESAQRLVMRPARNIGPVTLQNIREQGAAVGLKVSDFLNFRNYRHEEPFANLIKQHQTGRVVVLDTETTGRDVFQDEIIQIYAVEIVAGQPAGDFHHYIKNIKPVGDSEAVHGLSDEFLQQEGGEAAVVLKELKDFIGAAPIVAHNVNFDAPMIVENGQRHGVHFDLEECYDTLDLAKRFIQSDSYRLSVLAKKLTLSEATHDAKDDVLATAGLLQYLVNKLMDRQPARVKLWQEYSGKFLKLSTQLEQWKKKTYKLKPAEVIDHIWRDSGLGDYYAKTDNSESRQQSIETLLTLFKDRDDATCRPEVKLRDLITYAALAKDINFIGLDQGKIPVVTVHQVKGLEFDYVFIVGMNDRDFPLGNSKDIEEEKRLFYVALTRARQSVFISYSRFNPQGYPKAKSPFVDYIDGRFVAIE